MVKILTQGNGLKGFHGRVGDLTNMFDSFGNELYVGDVVIISNQDQYSKQNKYLGNEYGLSFVCEENTDIADWTNHNHQYVNGIASIWDSDVFGANPVDFSSDYWDALLERSEGWIVHKIKDHKNLAIGERIEFLYVDEVDELIE
jgi:hypothetical protein